MHNFKQAIRKYVTNINNKMTNWHSKKKKIGDLFLPFENSGITKEESGSSMMVVFVRR